MEVNAAHGGRVRLDGLPHLVVHIQDERLRHADAPVIVLEEPCDECVAVKFVRETGDKGLKRVKERVGDGRRVVAVGEKRQSRCLVGWRLRGICIIQLWIGVEAK